MNRKLWIVVGAGILVAGAVWLAVARSGGGVEVDAAPLARGTIREFVDEQAKTRLPETYLITMPISGRIEPISLSEGDAVTRGQTVAQLVARDLDLAVEQARAAVQRLDASLAENANVKVEQTAKLQSQQFVESIAAAVKAAIERVKSGEASYEFAEKTFGRVQRLTVTGAQTQEDLDRATLVMLQSKFDLQQDRLVQAAMTAMQAATNLLPTMIEQYIERRGLSGDVLRQQRAEALARLEQIEQDRRRGTMTSPVDGVVLQRFLTNERYLAAGTSLLEIGRLQEMEVEAELLTLDAVAVKPGDAVELYGPVVGPQPARGRVARIYPAGFTKLSSLGVEQQRVNVIVRIEADDLQRLLMQRQIGVGYRVRVRIITAEAGEALIAPRAALLRNQSGQWQVFAIRGGRARLLPVEVGLMNDEQAQILQGLKPDDRVIVAPESTLADGAAVRTAATPQ